MHLSVMTRGEILFTCVYCIQEGMIIGRHIRKNNGTIEQQKSHKFWPCKPRIMGMKKIFF